MQSHAKTLHVEYNDKQFHLATNFQENGDQLLLFLHGWGCAKEEFDDVWKSPEFAGYSIVVPDLPGFGESKMPKKFYSSMENLAEICKLLVEEIGARKVHVIGHSMGGAIGLFLAERIPNKFGSFMSVEGNLIGEDCSFTRKTTGKTYEEFKQNVVDKLDIVYKPKENALKHWLGWCKKADPVCLYNSGKSLVEWSFSHKLLEKFKALDKSKVYIHGEKSHLKKILALIPEINKISISKSGHFPMVDNPQEFYQKLAEALKHGV